jgi:hypothetical protein
VCAFLDCFIAAAPRNNGVGKAEIIAKPQHRRAKMHARATAARTAAMPPQITRSEWNS